MKPELDEAALVGGVLFDVVDPMAMAPVLAKLLMVPRLDRTRVRELGLEPALVESLRHGLSKDHATIELACFKGAAWVLGYRAAIRQDSWELVASLPSDIHLPQGLRRTTAETLVVLVCEAEKCIRFSAPYIDTKGIAFISDAIAAATNRGVDVEIFKPSLELGLRALEELQQTVTASGNPTKLRIIRMTDDAPWTHLKVMVVDELVAYVGSANFTGAGLGGRNLELGVVVRGDEVRVIDRVLNMYREQ